MLSDYMSDFVMILTEESVDEYGGISAVETESDTFKAGISQANSSERQIAFQRGLIVDFNIITIDKILHKDDIIKNVLDGKKYRITSNSDEIRNPAITFRSMQCTAQRTEE